MSLRFTVQLLLFAALAHAEVASPYVLLEASGSVPIASSSAAIVAGEFCNASTTHQLLVADAHSGDVTVLNAEWTPFVLTKYPKLLYHGCATDMSIIGGASAGEYSAAFAVSCPSDVVPSSALLLLDWSDGSCDQPVLRRVCLLYTSPSPRD